MKKSLLTFFCVYMACLTQAQSSASWLEAISGTRNSANITGIKMATDSSGNIYLAGSFTDTVDFNPGPGVYKLGSTYNYRGFVCKLSNLGEFIWAKCFQSSTRSMCLAIKPDKNNGIYVVGNFVDTVDLDPGPGVYKLAGTSYYAPYFICKLDPDGNFVRGRLYSTPSTNNSNSCSFSDFAIDDGGNLFLTGAFTGVVDFDPGPATNTLSSFYVNNNYVWDTYLEKQDSLGNIAWVKKMGSWTYDQSSAIDVDHSGHIFLTGYYADSTDIDFGPGVTILKSVAHTNDLFLCKYDTSAKLIWGRSIGTNDSDIPYALKRDSKENLYCGGNLNSRVFIFKMDSSGTFKWGKSWDVGNYTSVSISINSKDEAYVGGYFNYNTDLDPGPQTYQVSPFGGYDAFISKFDGEGNAACISRLGGYGQDYLQALATDKDDNIIASGLFNGVTSAGSMSVASTGYQDVFITKLGPCAKAIGVEEFNKLQDMLSAYPNPSAGKFNVRSSRGVRFTVYSAPGEEVYSGIANEGLNEINLSNQPKGLYFIRFQTREGNESSVKKIVIE